MTISQYTSSDEFDVWFDEERGTEIDYGVEDECDYEDYSEDS